MPIKLSDSMLDIYQCCTHRTKEQTKSSIQSTLDYNRIYYTCLFLKQYLSVVHLLHIQIHNSPKISPGWPHEVALDPASALLAHLLPLTDGLAGDLPIKG